MAGLTFENLTRYWVAAGVKIDFQGLPSVFAWLAMRVPFHANP
jgi:hypothetical protein